MSVQELQDEGTMLASKYTDFEFSYSKRGGETRATAELAIYRQHAAMFGFEADLHMPASLVKEKNGSGARIQMPKTPQPAAKKLSSIELLAKAAALRPAKRARWQRAQRKRRALLTRVDLGRRRAGGLLSWTAGKQPRQWTSGSSSGGRGQQQQHVRGNYRARGI